MMKTNTPMTISLARVAAPPLSVERQGDTLILNGEVLDLSGIPDGATLPRDAVKCDWLVSYIERIDGDLHLTLIAPYSGGNLPETLWYPEPLVVGADGPVELPDYYVGVSNEN